MIDSTPKSELMTNEEAIAILQKLIPPTYRGDGKSTTHLLVTIALNMAIAALKAEPCKDAVLDKIRGEISVLSDSKCEGNSVTIHSWSYMQRKVLGIIDKYKAESEESHASSN